MPKRLKLGVSAAWSSDASGWGAPSTSVPTDSWGGWGEGGGWGSSTGDIWDTVASEPAAADPPPDWGYDEGWDGPAPDLQAMDVFPSLAASKPSSKRGKTTGRNPPPRQKPANFSTVLGTRVGGPATKPGISGNHSESRMRTRNDSQDGKSWIQNSIDKNKSIDTNRQTDKPPNSSQSTRQARQSQSFLTQATREPSQSLKDILHIPSQGKFSDPRPSELSSMRTEVNTEQLKMRPQQPWFLREPSHTPAESDINVPVKGQSHDTKSPVLEKVTPKSKPDQIDVPPVATKRPIYDQLREQLQKVSSLGKPLVYIIQNGSITVKVAE